MGRLLDDGVKNILRIQDPVSGNRIGIYYRIPTTEERVGFLRDIWDRSVGKVIENLTTARIRWGEKIFEGFTDGSFSKTIDGQVKNISCQPDSEDYYPGWRDLIVQKSPDLLERLWQVVVEGSEVETAQEGPPEKK